jgi:hypothetical protein
VKIPGQYDFRAGGAGQQAETDQIAPDRSGPVGNASLVGPRDYDDERKAGEGWKRTAKADGEDPNTSELATSTDVSGTALSAHAFREDSGAGVGGEWKGAGTESATAQIGVDVNASTKSGSSGTLPIL